MKAKNTLALMFALMISTAAISENFRMKEEDGVDDIPFNTTLIAEAALATLDSIHSFDVLMQEECNVEDIPFDTNQIFVSAMAEKAENEQFKHTDEPSVMDIPFNTRLIAARHIYRQALYTMFENLKPIVVIRIEGSL